MFRNDINYLQIFKWYDTLGNDQFSYILECISETFNEEEAIQVKEYIWSEYKLYAKLTEFFPTKFSFPTQALPYSSNQGLFCIGKFENQKSGLLYEVFGFYTDEYD